jgi:hypothetical protein
MSDINSIFISDSMDRQAGRGYEAKNDSSQSLEIVWYVCTP